MKNKSIIFILGIFPLIPSAAHLAEGLIFVAEFWLLFASGVLSGMLTGYFKIKKASQILSYAGIMLTAALYAQIVGCIFPVPAISLTVYLYLFAFSYMLIISLDEYTATKGSLELPIAYSLLLPAVSLLRELLVFGTISLPVPSGLFSIKIIPFPSSFTFWGSGAGTLILLGIGLWLFHSAQKNELLPFQIDERRRRRP